MSRTIRLLACAAVLIGGAGALQAQNPAACQEVKFSEQVLSEFPRAPDACLDVISRDGEQYAVFRAELLDVFGNTLRVRFKHPDGTTGKPINVPTKANFRVLIDGKPTPVRDLVPNQELTAYVQVQKPMVALAPAVETETLFVVPLVAAAEEPPLASSSSSPSMPATASSLGLVALVGQFLLALALALTLIRKRRK